MNKHILRIKYFILCISIAGIAGGCATITKEASNDASAGLNIYKSISFEELLMNPNKYDNQPIAVYGIYSGYRSVIFKNAEDFKALNYKQSIFIFSKYDKNVKSKFVNVKHGSPVIVRGIFRATKEYEINVFFATIDDVFSVESRK